jgi:L,D-peptidoglycan transpeptidase YkuD (ErfK/YbiS/YcfS/YnhG family)
MNKNILLAGVAVALFCGCTQRQLLVVTPLDTNSSKGVAKLYENGFETASYDVMLGRNGVAKMNKKREGDGKTPSGEYSISALFGKEILNQSMIFIKTSKTLHCIDDVNSSYYNRIEDSEKIVKDYVSYEEMLRDDGLYDMGALIDYNKDGAKGLGSCIFIHISSGKETAGCVSMDAKSLNELLLKLDASKNPTIRINP